MHATDRITAPAAQRGFVFMTSLVFLAVITLVVVSATASSTLQQRMADNLRQQSQAHQAAAAALRVGEALLESTAFDSYRRPGSVVTLEDNDATGNGGSVKLRQPADIPGYGDGGSSEPFLGDVQWETAPAYIGAGNEDTAHYYIEDRGFRPRNLNPDSAARADGGQAYAITAHAQDQNAAARTTMQSVYMRYYAPAQ